MLEKDRLVVTGTELLSVYHFAQAIGKRPQQLYQMVGNGSFPPNLLTTVMSPSGKEQPMVKVEEAKKFFATKEAKQVDRTVTKIIEQPALVADAFISMVEKDDPKLGKKVREWWNKKNEPTPETK